MDTIRKLTLLIGATVLALAVMTGPVFAVEDTGETPASQEEDDDHRIALADSPRDRVGLILLGSLFAAAGIGIAGMRRQMRGEHEQATGEFRWR